MTIENKIDELTSIIKAMDVKIKFLLDDSEEMKAKLEEMNQTVMQIAMSPGQSSNTSKSERLEQFRQETARW